MRLFLTVLRLGDVTAGVDTAIQKQRRNETAASFIPCIWLSLVQYKTTKTHVSSVQHFLNFQLLRTSVATVYHQGDL